MVHVCETEDYKTLSSLVPISKLTTVFTWLNLLMDIICLISLPKTKTADSAHTELYEV